MDHYGDQVSIVIIHVTPGREGVLKFRVVLQTKKSWEPPLYVSSLPDEDSKLVQFAGQSVLLLGNSDYFLFL